MKTKIPSPEELLLAGVHYGHDTRHWHPKMKKYIYVKSANVHIIDLFKTQKLLADAAEFLYQVTKMGKKVIIVGTKDQSKETVEIEAKNCGGLFVNERWFGGTLTNFEEIKKNRNTLVSLKSDMAAKKFDNLTKKERLLISRQIDKLNLMHGGLVGLNERPGAVVIVDVKREKTTLKECIATNVPVVGLADTNTDPSNIDYIIPCNDDAIKSIALITRTLCEAITEGSGEYAKSLSAKK